MSISCLSGLVDILPNCGTPTRSTGVMYLDDLGISLQDAIDGNDQFDTGQDLVTNKINFAQQIIANDILTNYNGKLARNSVVSNGVAGYYKENRVEKTVTANKLGGIFIEINKYPYLEYYIHKVRLFTKNAETFDLKVIDIMTGQELFTQSVTTTASDYTDVEVNQAFKTQGQKTQLFIGYNKQDVVTYESEMQKKGCSSCLKRSTYDGFTYQYAAEITATDSLIYNNVNLVTDTAGVSLVYSLNCSLDNFVCSIRNRLQYPLLYLVASKIMEDIYYSKRQNSTTLIYRGDAREQMERFESEYKMAMFGAFDDQNRKIKDGLLDQLALPNDICFKCKQRVTRKAMIP